MQSIDVRLTVHQVWELLADPSAQRHWLPDGCSIAFHENGRGMMQDRLGRTYAVVVSAVAVAQNRRTFRLRFCQASPEGSPPDFPYNHELTIGRLSPRRSRVSWRWVGPHEPTEDLSEHWAASLHRLDNLVARIGRRKPRQAVVIVHGIGEQIPGDTLRGFVATVAGGSADTVWSRPDRHSGSYELRSLTLSRTGRRPATDFYEYYWAHVIRDTTMTDVGIWLWSILWRLPWRVPNHLRIVWALAWALVVAAGSLVLQLQELPESGVPWISLAVTAGIAVATGIVVHRFGDAARYLSPRPNNVRHREVIRERGLSLLNTLHRSGRYDRIILVGHSLGSVIAYDLVTHLWAQMNASHLRLDDVSFKALAALERAANGNGDEADGSPARSNDPHRLQHATWGELRRNGQPWLISDLVTLGSPLAHAELLLAQDRFDLADRVQQRELPVAPPVRENGRFAYRSAYVSRLGNRRSRDVLHHAAPFAVVRWTNLYFPAPLGLFGDAVGGPLRPQFGQWVRDVALGKDLPWHKRWTLLAHTCYFESRRATSRRWLLGLRRRVQPDSPANSRAESEHHAALKAALALDSRKDLQQRIQKHSVLAQLPDEELGAGL